MDHESDDDFERVSDVDFSGSENEQEVRTHETPGSTPPSRILRPSEQKTLQCSYDGCFKAFNRLARLNEHLRSHTNSRIFKCPHKPCAKDYLRETHRKHHIKSAHSDVRDYECTWQGCDKKFATGTRLRRHLEAHQGREKYRCRGYNGCNETFRKKETLQRHVAAVHEQMKLHPCPDVDNRSGRPCTKAFDSIDKLQQHQRTHHDLTRFSCSECLAFNASLAVDNTNTDLHQIKAFFATYAELQTHMAEVHPPTCALCSTSFTTQKELTRHLELQHDLKPVNTSPSQEFACSFPGCDKTYSKRGNLNVHMKTAHEKRRDFVCGQTELPLPEELEAGTIVYGCGRDFTSKASLEEHVRVAHLGLESKRTAREKKRKAENEEYTEYAEITDAKRRTRDKIVKKTSVIDTLTGVSTTRSHAQAQTTTNKLDKIDIPYDEEDEDEDYATLSGSMTMLGSHLYHHTGEYHYTSGQYPEGHLAPDSNAFSDKLHFLNGTIDEEDDGCFFEGFEPEPSFIDPQLRLDF